MPPTKERAIVFLTPKQKRFADEIVEQQRRGEEPNPTAAARVAYPEQDTKSLEVEASRTLRNAKVADYLMERLSNGEILTQQEAFTAIESETASLLKDVKQRRNDKVRLGVLMFAAKLYGLAADRVIVREEATSPKVERIYADIIDLDTAKTEPAADL